MDRGVIETDVNSIISLKCWPDGGVEKKAPENSIPSDLSSPLRSEERIQSRYLRSRMPSCHDICKYKTNATSADFRKFLKKKKNVARIGEQNQLTVLLPRETRMKTMIKTHEETEFLDIFVVPESESPTPLSSSPASNENNILIASLDKEQSQVTGLEAKVTEGETPLPSTSYSNKPDNTKFRESCINKKETKPSTKKPMSSVAPKATEKQAWPLAIEPQNIKKKVPSLPRRVDVAGKPATTLKAKTSPIRSVSQLNSSQSLIARRNQELKITRSLRTSKIGEGKLLNAPTTSISSKLSENLIGQSSKDNRTVENFATSKIGEGIVPKPNPMHVSSKTTHENLPSFHRIKLRNIRRISSPRENFSRVKARELVNAKENLTAREDVASLQARKLRRVTSLKDDVGKCHQPDTQSASENIDSDPNIKSEGSEPAISDIIDWEKEDNNKIEVPKGEERKKRTASSLREENTSTPFKLNFRRGIVVNPRPGSIGARRLWFGQGTSGNENPNGIRSAPRRSFRMRTLLDSTAPDSEARTFRLKHQDVTRKKDAQSLFNHVIKETASKLVETRKSKVKALVGAFETVISLQ